MDSACMRGFLQIITSSDVRSFFIDILMIFMTLSLYQKVNTQLLD